MASGTQYQNLTHQYLTFRLGGELYGLDVGHAREIIEFGPVTPIPRTPEWVRGVFNLRGNVIPVLDIKLKFGMGKTARTVDACILIVEIDLEGDLFVVGMLADSVQEVFELADSEVEPAPRFAKTVSTDYIRGIGNHDGQFFVILDVQKVFSSDELSVIGMAQGAAGGIS